MKNLYEKLLDAKKFECDSRSISEGDVFFALKGKNNDGHDFLSEVFKKGALYAIISEEEKKKEGCIVVDDVYKTLYGLAKYKKQFIKKPMIAITGSAGKTTTRDLIVSILSKKYKVGSNKKNFNSNISLPLQILNLENECDIFVFEIGATRPGDIKFKCDLLNPDYGIITNVGNMHLETFGSREKIFETKTELYDYVKKNEGVVFINYSQKKLIEKADSLEIKKKLYQFNNNNFVSFEKEDPMVWYRCNEKIFKTNLFGKYQIDNIASAYAIGKYFEVSESNIHDAIQNYMPKDNRSEKILTQKNNSIILDAYNANFDAIISGLKTFGTINSKNKIVILGSMRELGIESESLHKKIGEELKKLRFKDVILLGEEMRFAKKKCNESFFLKSKDELILFLINKKYCDSYFFIKGARFWGLEEIVKYL